MGKHRQVASADRAVSQDRRVSAAIRRRRRRNVPARIASRTREAVSYPLLSAAALGAWRWWLILRPLRLPRRQFPAVQWQCLRKRGLAASRNEQNVLRSTCLRIAGVELNALSARLR